MTTDAAGVEALSSTLDRGALRARVMLVAAEALADPRTVRKFFRDPNSVALLARERIARAVRAVDDRRLKRDRAVKRLSDPTPKSAA